MNSLLSSTKQIGLADNSGSSQVLYRFKPFVFQKVTYEKSKFPIARTGHRLVSNNHEIYCYGGYNSDARWPYFENSNLVINYPLFRELWKYNMAKRQWEKIPATNIPLLLASNVVLLKGTMLLVYGGTGDPFGSVVSRSLFVCDLGREMPHFKEIEAWGDAPQAGYGQAAFIHDGYMYVLGGTTGYEFNCDIHRLHFSTSKWEAVYVSGGLPGDPAGRYRHEVGLLLSESKIMVFGGGTSHTAYGFENIHVFDLEKKKWSTVVTTGDPEIRENSGYPMKRRYHSLAQMTNEKDIFITAGESGNAELSDSWKLNLETLQWKKMHSMELETTLYFHGSTLSPQGKLYIFGGKTHNTRLATMWNAWLCIPKLQEICWEAVLFYKLLDCLRWDRVQQTIPPQFLNRLK